MSQKRHHFFEFGDFRLDVDEKTLKRADLLVPLTPKVFETLKVFVENPGQLVEKGEFMEKIWPGRFVEESNLSFNIKMLRKALGDDAHSPRFIETVPSRGFRFIAAVTGSSDGLDSVTDLTTHSSDKDGYFQDSWSKIRQFAVPVFSFAVLLTGVIVAYSWYTSSSNTAGQAAILSAPFALEKLSTNGKVLHAVISRNGKIVVYTNGVDGRQSVWLREIESKNNVELIPPSDSRYGGLALSPDGNFLYFSRGPGDKNFLDIYRISIFGGIPAKIIDYTHGLISVSPDGSSISFVREPQEGGWYLCVADAADGKNEKTLISRSDQRIRAHKFAPDGRSIAFAAGQSENGANDVGLFEVDIATGVERELTSERFFDIKDIAWLDQDGLLITAQKNPDKNFRIWEVSPVSGVRPATDDSETYARLSMDAASSVLVSTKEKEDFRIKLFQMANPSAARVLTDATVVSFAPDGKIVFASQISGNNEIWKMNADESGQRQLTNDIAHDSSPISSPDGNSIFFVSNRSGAAHIWRMNSDGSNQTQLTHSDGGYPAFVSPDGNWVYFYHTQPRTLWRVSANGNDEHLVLNKSKPRFAFSPDGLKVAFSERQGTGNVLMVVALSDGKMIETFTLSDPNSSPIEIVWMPDGKNLAYILGGSYPKNGTLWLQPIDGGASRQIADLGEGSIEFFAVAPDGESFALVQGGRRYDAVLISGLR